MNEEKNKIIQEQDCIAAIATPNGKSAIAVIRISGLNAIAIVDEIFVGKILICSLFSLFLEIPRMFREKSS